MGKQRKSKKSSSKNKSPLCSPSRSSSSSQIPQEQANIISNLSHPTVTTRDAALTAVSQLISNSGFPLTPLTLKTVAERILDVDDSCSLSSIGAFNNLITSSRISDPLLNILVDNDLLTPLITKLNSTFLLLFSPSSTSTNDDEAKIQKKYLYPNMILFECLNLVSNLIEQSPPAHSILIQRFLADPNLYRNIVQLAIFTEKDNSVRQNIPKVQTACARVLHSAISDDVLSNADVLNLVGGDLAAVMGAVMGGEISTKARLHLAGYMLAFASTNKDVLNVIAPLAASLTWDGSEVEKLLCDINEKEKKAMNEADDEIIEKKAVANVKESGIKAIDIVKKHKKMKNEKGEKSKGGAEAEAEAEDDADMLPPPPQKQLQQPQPQPRPQQQQQQQLQQQQKPHRKNSKLQLKIGVIELHR